MKKSITSFLIAFSFILQAKSQEIFPYERAIEMKSTYSEIKISAINDEDNIMLSGSLILPSDDFSKIIFIVPGSGPDTRHNHPFLTETFLEKNIAVFRYDERGNGSSTGIYNDYNYTLPMLGRDVHTLVEKLKSIPILEGKIFGMLGHSYGGMGILEAIEIGIEPDFLVFLASPIQKHGAFFTHQLENDNPILKDKFKYNAVEEKVSVVEIINDEIGNNNHLPNQEIRKIAYKKAKEIGYTKRRYNKFSYFSTPYNLEMIKRNFEPIFKNITIPTLYAIGEKDPFISAKAETQLLKSIKNPKIKIKVFDRLGHFFKEEPLDIMDAYNMEHEPKEFITNWVRDLEF
ncbi:alpha/beta hydrolase [Belliella kenyensis]|uniref:Alpha/beta hydrolase n=1 Tax=Belliella kenyensis TaxID=1472724 RepID=A0ABV8ER68_9BACT|nr:alpha/beta hydrolase [Belliella kenyensis]MCH7402105.1 alpha/beta hydrolase [Belliella kenyensis]MDN3601547.1 alpha/beta hydrolase [Belliella kenyensis]